MSTKGGKQALEWVDLKARLAAPDQCRYGRVLVISHHLSATFAPSTLWRKGKRSESGGFYGASSEIIGRSRRRNQTEDRTGKTIKVSTVAVVRPPITTVANGFWTSEPGP